MAFAKATKQKQKLRLAIEGASGSGKTYSSLILATALGKKVAVVDTEHGSASLYADKFGFDVLDLRPPYTPESYIKAIEEAEKAGYDVLVLDSISHEWNGVGGCLDLVNQIGGAYTAWGKVTPRHDAFINRILASSMHMIATMRSKADYETGKDEKTGKMTVQKKGTAPIQRDSVDYEFTIVFDLNANHMATASKDRTGVFDGKDFNITADTGKVLLEWLNSGSEKPLPIVKKDAEPVQEKAAVFPATEAPKVPKGQKAGMNPDDVPPDEDQEPMPWEEPKPEEAKKPIPEPSPSADEVPSKGPMIKAQQDGIKGVRAALGISIDAALGLINHEGDWKELTYEQADALIAELKAMSHERK